MLFYFMGSIPLFRGWWGVQRKGGIEDWSSNNELQSLHSPLQFHKNSEKHTFTRKSLAGE